jgi:3-keto-disaccharide hydrolase
MFVPRAALLCLLLICTSAVTAAEEKFQFELFNGKNLAGWDVTNCKIAVEDGALVLKEGNGFVRSNLKYGDFVLELDWRALKPDNYDSGIYVRSQFPSSQRSRNWPDRYQINLKVGEEGSLVGVPAAAAKGLAKRGDWNHFKITAIGSKFALEINGKPAWTYDDIKDKDGYIGFQAETPLGGQFEFKNVRLTELGFRSLFNGKDLTGWQGDTQGYVVEDGKIAAMKTGHGNLYTNDEFADFIVRFDFRLEPGANNGLAVRAPLSGDAAYQGMEIQVLDDTDAQYKGIQPYQAHGSVYGIAPAKRGHLKPVGEWNSEEVICRGRQVTVSLNGTTIVDVNLDEASTPQTIDHREHPGLKRTTGHIGFCGHGARVEFNNLRVKPLKE